MFQFCKENTSSINNILISPSGIELVYNKIEERCQTKAILRTLSYHQFLYLTEVKLSMKRVSEQKQFPEIYKFCKVVKKILSWGQKSWALLDSYDHYVT